MSPPWPRPPEPVLNRPFILRSALEAPDRTMSKPVAAFVPALVLVLSVAAAGSPALADGDHERARAALQRGEIVPLRTILERAEREVPGRLLEAELEEEGGRLVYEIKLLGADGRVVELLYDARDGALIGAKGRGMVKPRPDGGGGRP